MLGWLGSAAESIGRVIRNFVGSSDSGSSSYSNSSSSNSNSLYEPDKVKVAEIEQQTQLQLAGKETERIELMKQAKLEILQEEAKFAVALHESQVHGFKQMSEIIIAMQASFNEVAEKRLQIIEHSSMEIIKDIERFYNDLQASIEQKDIEFTETKLPKLLEQLNKYAEESASHKLYFKKIDGLITQQESYAMRALENLSLRQNKIIASSLATKENITEHTDKLTAQIVDKLTTGHNDVLANTKVENANYDKQIGFNNPKLLEEKLNNQDE